MSDVIGIGLANMDLVAHVKDEFLKTHKIKKGLATKCDDLAFARLRADLPQFDAIPGGCAANTICGLAAHGVPSRFYGKIGSDPFESLYRASFGEYTVEYDVAPSPQESSQCAVLVTPDGERSFAYTHGASWDLDAADIDPAILAQASMIVTEIYIFEFGKNAALPKLVFETAQQHKIPLVMEVIDSDFGRRYSQKIRALADAGIVSLLVGNEQNLPSIIGGKDRNDLDQFKSWPCDVLMTAEKDGAYFISRGQVQHFPVVPVENPKNTTGAGDQFLAGFLTGRIDYKPVEECMGFAASCARAIIMHDTARPQLVHKHSIRF